MSEEKLVTLPATDVEYDKKAVKKEVLDCRSAVLMALDVAQTANPKFLAQLPQVVTGRHKAVDVEALAKKVRTSEIKGVMAVYRAKKAAKYVKKAYKDDGGTYTSFNASSFLEWLQANLANIITQFLAIFESCGS